MTTTVPVNYKWTVPLLTVGIEFYNLRVPTVDGHGRKNDLICGIVGVFFEDI